MKRSWVLDRLASAGFNNLEQGAKADLLARGAGALLDRGVPAVTRAHAFWVPGRIEVVGKHTDYAGGRSLLLAADKGFCFVAAPGGDRRLWVTDAVREETIQFEISPHLVAVSEHWSNYPMTVGGRLARNFGGHLKGGSVAFASDLPRAAGMSSSSALIVGFSLVLVVLNQLQTAAPFRSNIQTAEDLAAYLGRVENGRSFKALAGDRGVGTFGGSEDHTAILCCQPDQLSLYSFHPVHRERNIDFPADLTLLVASSGVKADKTGSAMGKYNRASRLAAEAAARWREDTGCDDPDLAAVAARFPTSCQPVLEVLRRPFTSDFSAAEVADRFEHFYQESVKIVPHAAVALARGDLKTFGRLVDRSQKEAERLLGNQVPETVFLARCARQLGAAAASAFGAGFGGSVWALTGTSRARGLLERWSSRYQAGFPERAQEARFFTTRPGPPAQQLLSEKQSLFAATRIGPEASSHPEAPD
ncbi:MAG: galactokinase family protein [Acidobacteriota bacterium]